MSTVDLINKALEKVIDPELHKPLPELGMVESVKFVNSTAHIGILLTIVGCPMKDRLKSDITNALSEISEIKSVEINFGVMSEEQRNHVKKLIIMIHYKYPSCGTTSHINFSIRMHYTGCNSKIIRCLYGS